MYLIPLLISALGGQAWGEPQLRLTPDMVLNETGFGEASALVDEQDCDRANPPLNPFFGGWTAWQYPMSFVVDLGSECDVRRVTIYNHEGGGSIELGTGLPFRWKSVRHELMGKDTWHDFAVGLKTRWLRLVVNQPLSLSELLVFGTRIHPVAVPRVPRPRRTSLTIDQLVGVNAFIDDPIDKISTPANFVREYHPWGWDVEGPNAARRFQPSGAAGGNSWFFDDYYRKLKEAGMVIAPVIWEAPEPLFHPKTKEAKPISTGADSENPASYRLHAEHFFQVAARYGKRKVADSLLDLAPEQPRRSGLGLLGWLEAWNEPDKTWEGREGRFNPYELAALCSADYDGDQGRMGKAVGVKAADPAMKLAMGGTAGLSLELIRAMKFWADWHRKGDFPADALNVHHYSSSSNEQWFQPGGHGISPEDDDLRGKLLRLANWRDANIPDRELWLTEFGYDTNPKSPLHVPALGSMSAEAVQGAWLVRSILALAAARVDRAAMFMLRDTNSKGTGVFETCGLVSEKGAWVPKASWYYLATLKSVLQGYRFGREVASSDPSVLTYEFVGPGGVKAFAIWCKTSEDRRVQGYRFRTSARKVRAVSSVAGQLKGASRSLVASGGVISVDVSETPTLLLTE